MGVVVNTWVSWERGTRTPRLWRVPEISAALGVPLGAVLVENGRATCVAEVWMGAETIRDIRRGGRPGALEAAERIARQLEPLLWQAPTGRLPRAQDTPARARPRRSRLEVLAGVKAASEARTQARLRYLASEVDAIGADPEADT